MKGTIGSHGFRQTLLPVKNEPYRLIINAPMLKGSGTDTGDKVKFMIEEDNEPRAIPMPPALQKALAENEPAAAFNSLTPGRQKEISNISTT